MPHQIIMAAPNGARKTKSDHPNLAISIEETVAEAKRSFEQGATVLHAHVRGKNHEHVLDPGLYRELLTEMRAHVPNMLIQMTTEAVGRYTAQQQADCVYAVRPKMISMAVREMAPAGGDTVLAKSFYSWTRENNVNVQHIVFDTDDLVRLFQLQSDGVISKDRLCVLFVLGRFSEGRESRPDDIAPFLEIGQSRPMDWFVCAFGAQEHACALQALTLGGHARVGFENNLLLTDGRPAEHSADLVSQLTAAAVKQGIQIADIDQTRSILGVSG
jgi:3-keto-5-aminohexanoate cleavage enzyme